MEQLTQLVVDSLARHGYGVALDHRRLEWSRWFRCESSFSLLLVPSAAGLYALAEEMVTAEKTPPAGGKRMLALFQISQSEDLCLSLSRMFAPRNPLSARLATGRCFVRFALVADAKQRQTACESLNRWLASSSEVASGFGKDFSNDFSVADENAALPEPPAKSTTIQTELTAGTPHNEPPPLPAGF